MAGYSDKPHRIVQMCGFTVSAAIVGIGTFSVTSTRWRWFRRTVTTHTLLVEGYATDSGMGIGVGAYLDGRGVKVEFQHGKLLIDGKLYRGVTERQFNRASGMYTTEEIMASIFGRS